MKLRWHPAAADEAERAVEYLEQRQIGLGSAFAAIMRESLARIEERPDSSSPLETAPVGSGYRRLIMPVFRYLIIYRQSADQIIVVAVSHPSREPNYWLGRENDSGTTV